MARATRPRRRHSRRARARPEKWPQAAFRARQLLAPPRPFEVRRGRLSARQSTGRQHWRCFPVHATRRSAGINAPHRPKRRLRPIQWRPESGGMKEWPMPTRPGHFPFGSLLFSSAVSFLNAAPLRCTSRGSKPQTFSKDFVHATVLSKQYHGQRYVTQPAQALPALSPVSSGSLCQTVYPDGEPMAPPPIPHHAHT